MITLTETERSVIARLEPGEQALTVINLNGTRITAQHDLLPWLHLVHTYSHTRPRWFGDSTKLALNLHSTGRTPIEDAVAEVLGNPGCIAMVVWSPQQRRDRDGQPYGQPLWLPVGYRLAPYEPETQEVPDAL